MDVARALPANADDSLVTPYGGSLVQRYVPADERETVLASIPRYPRVDVNEAEFHDVEMLGSGAYSPLHGFMSRDTLLSVCEAGTLPGGLAWGLPVSLTVPADQARRLRPGHDAVLFHRDEPVALLSVSDIFLWEDVPSGEIVPLAGGAAANVGRYSPGKTYRVAGDVTLLASRNDSFLQHHHLWPRETRSLFTQRRWRHVAAVHVQNPWQRAHEYLLKCALESSDGLLLHAPIDDYDQGDGVHRAALSVASRLLLTEFFREDRIVINPVPRHVFSSSIRGVLQHAIIAQNAGCDSLYLVPAPNQSPDDFRAQMDAAFADAAQRGLRVRPAYMAPAFHCERCGGIATTKSCPHGSESRIVVTDADIAETLRRGEQLPLVVTRPEIARALARSVADAVSDGESDSHHLYPHVGEVSRTLRQTLIGHRPCVLWMTGLSGSGKSTIAHRLERMLLLSDHRVTVLDGDTLRHGLNRDLGFSEEARRENLRRAGEVAKILMDSGLIVIASFISPFAAERRMVREMFSEGFFEIYIEAALEVCEARDPKGLYRRARAGQIPSFTGLTSPYEVPTHPDLRLDTGSLGLDQCVHVLHSFLADAGVLRTAGRLAGASAPFGRVGIQGKSSLQ